MHRSAGDASALGVADLENAPDSSCAGAMKHHTVRPNETWTC